MVLDKKILRKEMIRMRLDIDDLTYHRLSHFIIEKLKQTDDFASANTIGIYLSYNNEVDTWQFIKDVINVKTICVPVIEQNQQMNFVQISQWSKFKKNKYGIDEPVSGRIINKNEIDLIVVPLVAYNDDNYRLGYGGGYYDRFLKDYHGKTIGIAFQMQRLKEYIPEKHDIPLYKIITE